jgi:D-beta-D-heptose 7-phosphate kinase/D-beta-D-heptose 1-phosphate adenosyltransferase
MKFNIQHLTDVHILVIGDIMLDQYIWGKVERISPEAPVPIVHVQNKTYMVGGAANVARNLNAVGCHASVMGRCGTDKAGQQLRTLLDRHRITHHLLVEEGFQTITKTRVMAMEQQLLRIDEEEITPLNASSVGGFMDKITAMLQQVKGVILSDYGKGLLQTPGVTESIIKLCRAADITVVIDPKGIDWRRYQGATCITPNIGELKLVAGNRPVDSDADLAQTAASVCHEFQLERLLVTRGARGMCLAGTSAPPFLIPTQAREVYDVSGAGDTAIAIFTAGLTLGLSFEDAAGLANQAAGVVVGKIGTQAVTADELHSCVGSICFKC